MAKTLQELAKAFNALDIARNGCLVHEAYTFINKEFRSYIRDITEGRNKADLKIPDGMDIDDVLSKFGRYRSREIADERGAVKSFGGWIASDLLPCVDCRTPLYKTLQVISRGLKNAEFADKAAIGLSREFCGVLDDVIKVGDNKEAYEQGADGTTYGKSDGLRELNGELIDNDINFWFCKGVFNNREEALKLQKLLRNGIHKRSDCVAIAGLLKKDPALKSKFETLSKILP